MNLYRGIKLQNLTFAQTVDTETLRK